MDNKKYKSDFVQNNSNFLSYLEIYKFLNKAPER